MTIQSFIETAIKGGWCPKDQQGNEIELQGQENHPVVLQELKNIHKILLDPLAWEAVGKVKGWNSKERQVIHVESFPYEEWQGNMVRMIHELLKGRTIEEYIATL